MHMNLRCIQSGVKHIPLIFKYQNMNKRIVLILIVTIITIGAIFGSILLFINLNTDEDSEYKPKFSEEYPMQIIEEKDGLFVYYLTDNSFTIGEEFDYYTFISAQNKTFEKLAAKVIAYNGQDQYIQVELTGKSINPDCIAVYKDDVLYRDWQNGSLISRFPKPSDASMCSEFDFENVELE